MDNSKKYYDKEKNKMQATVTDTYTTTLPSHLSGYFQAEMGEKEGKAYYQEYIDHTASYFLSKSPNHNGKVRKKRG